MIECIDKTELAHKITEVLIQTQFRMWIEPEDVPLTVEAMKLKDKRAFQLYIGKSTGSVEDLEFNKFRAIIKQQTAMIMRLIDV